MGTGCQSVSCTMTEGGHLVVGTWDGGRIGTFRGIRSGKSGYGATVFGAKAIESGGNYEGYLPLVQEICKFFKTGKSPVPKAETIELFAFMEDARCEQTARRQAGFDRRNDQKAEEFNAKRACPLKRSQAGAWERGEWETRLPAETFPSRSLGTKQSRSLTANRR